MAILRLRGGVAVAVLGFSCVAWGQTVAGSAPGVPVVVENCGASFTYLEPPKRAVAMNQSATETMLALGLQGRLTGSAYLDDAVPREWAATYATIPVLSEGYPAREILLGVRPDFVYAAYPSAFAQDAAGAREDLMRLGVRSYLSPAGCGASGRRERVSIATLYQELRDIGRIFGVSARAEALISRYQAEIGLMQARVAVRARPARVFWYDSGDPPSAAACCGVPNEIMRLAGVENVFADAPGSWATVSWEEVVARNPDTIVLVDARWSTAAEKQRLLRAGRAYASIEAVNRQRFVTLDFSSSTSPIRIAASVRTLVESLYPETVK